jgi:2-methylcitrate dehydratase PrpD
VTPAADPSITEDQSHIEVELVDGRKLTHFVEQSLGNVNRPLTDRQLEEKFRDQAVPLLTASRVDHLIDLCWRIDELSNVDEIIKATIPE